MNADPKRVEAIFAAVLEQPPAERAAYLTDACLGDEALRQRVEALLKAHDAADDFLANPMLEPAAHDRALAGAPTIGVVSTATSETAALTRIRYFGDYELGAEMGRGGMGLVYRATQVSLNRPVALKMILAGQLASEADVQRFQREAEAAANLDHPNIVPIYEIGQHEGLHYFSMKLIEGTSLAERAAGFMRDPRSAVKMLAKVARAVHHAHQHGILHRDLKPSNILLDTHDEPFVTDFGLAKRVDGSNAQTRSGVIVGTPGYMAPEQARSEKALTVAVDVYGLGAILYELLTGRPPFRAETELETILQVLDRDPPPPRALNGRIDRDLETICLKCLDKQPRSRYTSALALAEELERWLAGYTIQARPSGSAKKMFKWAKRNPSLAILLVVLPCWYLNVRLPWQWAWLDWAFLGVMLLLGLARLVLLCCELLGKVTKTPLETSDVFLLPGVLAATLVLCFYPGALADRRSLADAIVMTPLFCGYALQWLWRRNQAGPLAQALYGPGRVVILCIFVILVIADVAKFGAVAEQTGDRLVFLAERAHALSGFIFCFLLLTVGVEIRKRGVVTFFKFIRWEEIESFAWKRKTAKDPRYSLYLQLNLCNDPLPLETYVYPPQKEATDRVLVEHLPRGEQEVADLCDSAESIAPVERKPIDWLGPATLGLIVSGLIQMAGSILLTVLLGLPQVLASDSAPVEPIFLALLVPLTLGGILVGAIVTVGAVRMRRRENYRFCRRSALLAVLPLGYGFLLGLPFGAWALLVLRRPAVRASFAENEVR